MNHLHRLIKHPAFLRLGGEAMWIALGSGCSVLAMLLGVRLLTSVLSLEAYGELALGMTAATLINQVILGPLSGAAMRFFAPAHEARELGGFLTALRRLLIKAGVAIVVLAGCVCAGLLIFGQAVWLPLSLAAIGFALLSGYGAVLDGIQNAARQRPIVAGHQAIAAWIRILFALGLALWISSTAPMVMAGFILASFLVLMSQMWFFKRTMRSTARHEGSGPETAALWHSRMCAYTWPFMAWGIFSWLQMASDRWALQIFTDTREVGLYTALYQLGYYPILFLSGIVMQWVMPVLFQKAGDTSDPARMDRAHRLNNRLSVASLGFTALSTFGALMLHTPLFALLVAPEYRAASELFPGMVMAGGLFATGQTLSLSSLSANRPLTLMWPKVGTAVVGMLLNTWGARLYGVEGVVLAMIISSAIYCMWIYLLTCRTGTHKAGT